MLSFIQKHWKALAAGAVGLFLLIGVITLSVNWFQARNLDKARKQYEVESKTWETTKAELLGRIKERDREILELESQKAQYKTLAEQGVKLDQEHAKQIEEVTNQEAKDLESARKDMDCRTRAADTVALLRTAKPPIHLDLAAVIRKQCSG